jgi:hypothetical protein
MIVLEIFGLISLLTCLSCTIYGIFTINRLKKQSGLPIEEFHVSKRDKTSEIGKKFHRSAKIIAFGAMFYVGMILLIMGIRYLMGDFDS